ncbi:hypothetical protein D0T87_22650 [Bacteroides sp. 51]|nr:hypothetical protein [Bacteroides sp. 51]
MTERVAFSFAPADCTSYPLKPFSSYYSISFIATSSFYTISAISEYSIYPMGFTKCEGLPHDFKAWFKMYFFRILPPAEGNRQEKPASKVRW